MNKVIIIDDEPLAISVISGYLAAYSDFEIVASCLNGFEGLKAIQTHQPDLIFLDIQMPKISGFEMLELIENPPSVIFSTAFDEFAIKAFEANAIDYLLKPFTKERFDKAVLKWLDLKSHSGSFSNTKKAVSQIPFPSEENQRIVVKSGNNIRIIPFDEIIYIEAYDDYVKIHIDHDCFLKKQTMQKVEELLGEEKFLRVHRSYIIKLTEITRLNSWKESFLAILRDDTKIPLSKTGYSN
ncbi:MAG: response regulator transcription factor [Bacteroidetes bacterium]|nr:response regulator transcription factor [Bacteroidota bacterium]